MIERQSWRIAVDDVSPPGVRSLAARVVVDADRIGEQPTVLCCFPGGGMSSHYFELDGYDMAGHLAAAGLVVVLIDHPGVGASDVPDDGWALTPEVVADIDAVAATRALDRLGYQQPVVIGVGHSMGAMLACYQQVRHRPYAGLVLIGHSGRGLPEVLDEAELEVGGDPERVRASVVALAQRRFGRPFPAGSTAASEMLVGPDLGDAASAAIGTASAPLLAVCGMTTLFPDGHTHVLAPIDVPILLEVAADDIVGPPDEVPGYFPACPDVTLHVLPDAFHNSNVAPTREQMWDSVVAWVGRRVGPVSPAAEPRRSGSR